mgnify:CR=1 FL=1
MTTALPADPIAALPAGSEVGSLARSGACWTFGMVVSRQALNLGATVILARLLSPADYGLVAMVMTLTAFFQFFSDMGLSWATVQRSAITRQQVDNLFWVNAAFGALLWGACALGGPLLNRFYGRSELAPVAAALGAGFLLGGVAVQPTALLRRQMRLRALALMEVAARAAGAAAGVAMALAGFGYWSLVGQALVAQAVAGALALLVSGHRPGAPHRGAETGALIRFGGYLAGFSAIVYVGRNLDMVLVGKCFGPDQLGFYSRAAFLMTLPALLATGSLSGVMIPALSALQHDRERMGAAYRSAIHGIALIGFPVAVGLAVTAPEVVRLVYGERWAPVVPILFWLSIAGLFLPSGITYGWMYVAAGKTRGLFHWGLCQTCFLAGGLLIGLRWGVVGVAAAQTVASMVLTVPSLWLAHRAAGIGFGPTMRRLAFPFKASLVMGAISWLFGQLTVSSGFGWEAMLAAKVIAGVAAYAALCRREVLRLVSPETAWLRQAPLPRVS